MKISHEIKNIAFIFITCILLTSCQKENVEELALGEVEEQKASSSVVIPSSFNQKLLMELYTTNGCATCPDAQQKCRNYQANYPDRIYGITIHDADAMASAQYDVLDSLFNITVYSSATFNRLPFNGSVVLHKTDWTSSIVQTCLNKTAPCGLKINSTIAGTSASATVFCGFNQSMTGDYRVTVYLMEDSVSGSGANYNQANYYNNTVNSPFYQMGNPIVGYQHPWVLRKVLSSGTGNLIPSANIKANGVYASNFNFNIAGYDINQLYVVAFINKAGSNAAAHEVMNVQRVKLGQNKNWD